MGKYNNMMKCAQVRSLVSEKQYQKALDIIEELNIEQINTITDLNIIAEVFKKFERYEDAREIYLRLYDRLQTRRVIYQLIYLSVKCNNIDDAEEFYKEYLELNDKSSDRLILRYYIDKAKGVDRKTLIRYLEELKQEDYMEEWAYELAKLYHKEGMEEECVRECSDIILWFGEGMIVEKAMLLKLHYVDGADISNAKAIEKTRNMAAELKMAAEIAEQNERRKIEEELRRKELYEEIRSKREEEKRKAANENKKTDEALDETKKIGNLSDYIKERQAVVKNCEDSEDSYEEENTDQVFAEEDNYKGKLLEVQKMLDKIREEQDSEDYNPEDHLEDPPEPDDEYEEEIQPIIENALSEEEQALAGMVEEAKKKGKIPHFVLIGDDKTKITELSKELAKELCRQGILPTSQIARITAERLNSIKLQDNQEKLSGGCLLIEEAYKLSLESVRSLYQFLNHNKNMITIILTDTEENIDWLMTRNRKLKSIVEYQLKL